MTSLVDKGVVIAVSDWPILAFAAPVAGVLAGVIATNVMYRLWQAGHASVPVVVLAMVVPMIIVSLLVFKTSPGLIRFEQNELVLDRIAFLDKRVQLGKAQLSLHRWYPDWTPVARGIQLHVFDGSTRLRFGVSDQPLMDFYDTQQPGVLEQQTTKMPHALLSRPQFIQLLEQLGDPAGHYREIARGAG